MLIPKFPGSALPLVSSVCVLLGCASLDRQPQLCAPGAYRCVGSTALLCTADGTAEVVTKDCAESGLACTSRGCAFCEPDARQCDGTVLRRCNSAGTAFNPLPEKECSRANAEVCYQGNCINGCQLARQNRSYVGCEYWAVDLDNAVVETGNAAAQQYAVVLSNPSPLEANVKVLINDAPYGEPIQLKEVTRRKVAPQALAVVLLPSREVDGSPPGQYNTGGGTAVTPNAYKIESDAPLIAYQFNPLSNVGVFSNDATVLVPTEALTTDPTNLVGADYMVMGWPQTIAKTDDPRTDFGDNLRAFLTIVGTREATQVKVTLKTAIVPDLAGKIPALKAGDVLTYKLGPFDVLNLETGAFGADFTGSQIDTDKPVVVFSGSEASDVPSFTDLSQRRCCADHLEHQLFPLPTLGTTYIAVTTPKRTKALFEAGATITEKEETEYFRVLATGEFTGITTNLDPPQKTFTLNGGESRILKVTGNFTLQATDPVVVGQFVAGQQEAGIPSSLPGGDPTFILLPPVEQFRKDYLFLTPDKYAFDFVTVAAPATARVTLDGREVKDGCDEKLGRKFCCNKSKVGPVMIPGNASVIDFVAYKCQLSFPKVQPDRIPPDNFVPGLQNDGVHRLQSDEKVGLVVYGFDRYVSYGYTGGTDLALINLE